MSESAAVETAAGATVEPPQLALRLTRDRPPHDWGENWWQTDPTAYDLSRLWFKSGRDRAAFLSCLDDAIMKGASAAEIRGYHLGYVDAALTAMAEADGVQLPAER